MTGTVEEETKENPCRPWACLEDWYETRFRNWELTQRIIKEMGTRMGQELFLRREQAKGVSFFLNYIKSTFPGNSDCKQTGYFIKRLLL